MALPDNNRHEMEHQAAVLDVDRHAGNKAPTSLVPKSQVGGAFKLNIAVARGKAEKLNGSGSFPYGTDLGSNSISTSFPPGLEALEYKQLRHVSLGPDRKDYRRASRWNNEALFF
jgi:hypothetical protein